MEKLQRERTDWWDTTSNEDREAIQEGLSQLDKGEYLTRSQVSAKIKGHFSF